MSESVAMILYLRCSDSYPVLYFFYLYLRIKTLNRTSKNNYDNQPIKTENDYQQPLERLEVIFDSKKGTPEGDEVEKLGVLIEAYENEKFPIG